MKSDQDTIAVAEVDVVTPGVTFSSDAQGCLHSASFSASAIAVADGVDPHVVMAWIAVRNIEREIELGLRQKARVYKTASGGHVDSVTIAIAAAKRRGVDMNIVPGRPLLVKQCWCGTMFATTSRASLCKECLKLKSQNVCAGYEGPCPKGAVPHRKAFGSSLIAIRGGDPWRCSPCAARKRIASKTPDQRSAASRKAMASRTPEQRSAASRKGMASKTPEQRSAVARKMNANRTPEQRSAVTRKIMASKTPEQRSAAARKMHANRTPERRSASARKGAATRKSRQIH